MVFKRVFAVSILLIGLLLVSTTSLMGEVIEQIVAQVNNDVITLTQYNREKQGLYMAMRGRYKGEELQKKYQEAVKKILPALIDELLLIQKAKEYGMDEDLDLEANAYVEKMMKANNIPSIEALKAEMARSGVRYEDYMTNLRKQILVNRIKGAIIRQKIKIMTDEIKDYYKKHKDAFTIPEKVDLAEIVVYTKDKKEAKAKAIINQVEEELKAGQEFEELAKKVSEGPTASEGGNIGAFPVPSLSNQIAKEVALLKVGQYSRPIKTSFGYEIVKLLKRTPGRVRSLKEVKSEIEDKIFQERLGPVLNDYIKQLRSESYIYVFPEFRKDYNPVEDDNE